MTTAVMATPAATEADWTVAAPFVVAQRGVGFEALFTDHMAWLRLPTRYTEMLNRIHDLTGWSFRDISDVVGTSHTTVGKLANGARPSPRSQEAADRIEPLLDVLIRLSSLVSPGPDLVTVLESATGTGETVLEILEAADWSRALLAAMDVINGPRPARPQPYRGGQRREAATQELR
jgi:hypothetical protein